LKIGIIGAGYWGKKHIDEYVKLGHEVHVADISKENRDFCKLNFNAYTYENYNEILNNDEIKLVSICTPNSTHKKIAITSLEKHKDIFVEKPLSLLVKDVDDIFECSKKMNQIVMNGHIFRFNNALKRIKEIITNDELGKIYVINLKWLEYYPILEGKDILFDQGVHPVDIVDFLFDSNVTKINCFNSSFRTQNMEHTILTYKIKTNNSHPLVNIELSWITPIRNRSLTIIGSEKTVIVDCVSQKIQLIENSSKTTYDVNVEPNNTLKDELDFFIKCSKNYTILEKPMPSIEVARNIIDILEKAKLSSNF
jgi:UDP-N-acetylglucosamine 3-dehydrogenase